MANKKEKVENFLNASKDMDNFLVVCKGEFDKELKNVIGITGEMKDNLSIEYSPDKRCVFLQYTFHSEYIKEVIHATTMTNEDPKAYLCVVDFLTETYYIHNELDKIRKFCKDITNELTKYFVDTEKDVLAMLEASKKFFFRLTHPSTPQVIEELNNKISFTKNVLKEFDPEVRFISSDLSEESIKTFVEVIKYVYGYMDLKQINDPEEE